MKARLISAAILVTAFHSLVAADETYKFDQARSTIGFSVHQLLGTTHGKFRKFDGKVDIDHQHPENSAVTALIDVRSIDTGIVKRDNHLRSPEFFDVEKYPEIAFKSRNVKQTGAQVWDIVGDLTMHGVTRTITLHAKLLSSPDDPQQPRWSVTADPLKRADFNLMFAQAAETVSGISQTVAISIEIEATRGQ
jgi:polyisoprenoid-binding protein YceI